MKVLIIKTGLTETFDTVSLHKNVISLGDVLRSTVLLHCLKDAHVTWLTSQRAAYLLDSISGIHALVTEASEISPDQFDLVINLERGQVELNLVSGLPKSKVIGYLSGDSIRDVHRTAQLSDWLQTTRSLNWSEKLFSLLGKSWEQHGYFLNTSALIPANRNKYDVGFNWQVGEKWPSKSWPHSRWSSLEDRLQQTHSVSWQRGFNDLAEYVSWIDSCRVVLTHDSLGLHIAMALGKNFVGLFGPTASYEIPLQGGVALSVAEREGFGCPPCYKDRCHNTIHCMETLSIDEVEGVLRALLKGNDERVETRRK